MILILLIVVPIIDFFGYFAADLTSEEYFSLIKVFTLCNLSYGIATAIIKKIISKINDSKDGITIDINKEYTRHIISFYYLSNIFIFPLIIAPILLSTYYFAFKFDLYFITKTTFYILIATSFLGIFLKGTILDSSKKDAKAEAVKSNSPP